MSYQITISDQERDILAQTAQARSLRIEQLLHEFIDGLRLITQNPSLKGSEKPAKPTRVDCDFTAPATLQPPAMEKPADQSITAKDSSTMVPVKTVADFFLAVANECEEPITNMKLNKLVYYAQAWHLAVFSKPLFLEEIEAGVHGPIIRAVYDTYRNFRWKPIITGDLKREEIEQQFNSDQQDILNDIVEIYMPDTAYALEQLTCNEDPWLLARNGLAPYEHSNTIITHDSMRAYYATKLEKK